MPLAFTVGDVADAAPAAPLDDPRAFMEWLVSRAGSQAELGRRAGISPDTISDYVRGKNQPLLENALKLLRAADVRIEGMPDRPDPLVEAVRVLHRLEIELLDEASQPPEVPEGS